MRIGRAGGGVPRLGAVAAAAALIAAFWPGQASGQYFGRNKVQYDRFDWQVMETPRFDIHFYPEAEPAIRDAARMAERWYDRLSAAWQHELPANQPIILFADHPDFQQTNVAQGFIGEGTGGFTEGMKNRVVMPLTNSYAETDHVLGHELVHAFQYDIALGRGGAGIEGLARLPLWLVEGMAEYLSLGRVHPHTALYLRDAALRADVPTIDQLTRDRRFFPYRYGQALMAYIGGRWGDRAVTQLFRYAAREGVPLAVQHVLGLTLDELSRDWITAVRAAYLPMMQGRTPPGEAGQLVLSPERGAGEMNVSPVLSPDGRHVAFLSEISLFSIDLFLADAHTGEVLGRLASSTADVHMEALSFINTAGTFSPDGSQLAIVVLAQGDHEIGIIDVSRRRMARRIQVSGVGSITNPAWSPDGRTLVFSGTEGGISDLYLLDLETGQTRQLMQDRHADLHPAWSPDGRTIAFVTDRGPETDFDRLTYGPMRLALYDLATGSVTTLAPFPGWTHTNPQFSRDGSQLYFVSNREGFQDIFRLTIATGVVEQITNLATGVSGITELSPAITVARHTGRTLFSVFEANTYRIYGLDEADMRPVPVPAAAAVATAAVLPPAEALGQTLIAQYLADPAGGLPAAADFPVEPYRPRLTLDWIGSPGVGLAVNRFGVGAAGGLALLFTDMLGDRLVAAAVQASGSLKDVGGEVLYLNRERRWAWGATAGHLPYIIGAQMWIEPTDNPRQQVWNQQINRIFVQQAQLLTHYPFSTTRRFEVTGGYMRIAFDTEILRQVVQDGRTIVDERIVQGESPPSLNLFQVAPALVGDWSFFGFTSPVMGGRYRLEVQPTAGSLRFVSTLADYRRYSFLRPLTFAVRGFHFARWGNADQINQLQPVFLGHPSLVRGYSVNSMEQRECVPVRDSEGRIIDTCPVFSRLAGSGVMVANAELRIPVLGIRELGLIEFPYLPLEVAPFVDVGVAWRGTTFPQLTWTRDTDVRAPVASVGITSRMNILGYIILEIYYANPFQRPERGAHWGFNIAPGW
jgi:Tol biopolymer transport system component